MAARKGTKHHYAKLNDELVVQIRQRYDNGMSLHKLQGWLWSIGVEIECISTIRAVTSRAAWKHVPEVENNCE